MVNMDPTLTSEPSLSRSVRFVAVYRASWSAFFDEIVQAAVAAKIEPESNSFSSEELRALQSDGVGLISEFFYLVRTAGLSSPSKLRGFLDRHNADMKNLAESCQGGYTKTGLSLERIQKSIFSEKQIAYVMHESSHGELRLDQNSLQRIFVQSMSFESCRSKLVLLAEFGLLRRHEYNQVLISSPGILEDAYARHVERVLASL